MRPRLFWSFLPTALSPAHMAKLTVTLMSLFLLSIPAWAVDGEEAVQDILNRMSQANRELDYQGIFTYEYAGVLKSVRVTHVVRDGVGYERWFYLNGPRQEVLRFGPDSDCPFGGDAQIQGQMPPALKDSRLLQNYYELQLRGEDRVADRSVWIIHLVPRDLLRYGYVFAIDQQTGLLLQSLLLDSDKRVMERFQYMDVSYVVEPDVARVIVDQLDAGGTATRCLQASRGAPLSAGWQAEWLPPGFNLASRDRDENGFETQLFSDGLSVFSIFFDPSGGKQLPEVQAQRGATVAQMARVEGGGRDYLVSVVGEIPIETAQRIAGYVKYSGE